MRHWNRSSTVIGSTLLILAVAGCSKATEMTPGAPGGTGGAGGAAAGGDDGIGGSVLFCSQSDNTCVDGQAKTCTPDGSSFLEFHCDPVQGMTCDPDGCKGACTPDKIGQSYIGCEYWPTVTPNSVWPGFDYAVTVVNTGDETATVTIELGEDLAARENVAPGALATLVLPWQMALKGPEPGANSDTGPSKVVVDGGYRLRSTQPVTVSQFSPLQYVKPYGPNCPHEPFENIPPGCYSFQNDASLLLPTNALGKDYQTLSYFTMPTWQLLQFQAGFITVTATDDDTQVTLLVPNDDPMFAPGDPIDAHGAGTVTLDRGDVLSIHSARLPIDEGENPGFDVSGTRVVATKPVQVVSGVSCANVPADAPYCDHLEESMPPTQALGRDYLVAVPGSPGSDAPSPHTIRVQAVFPDTAVVFDPPIAEPVTLQPTDPPLELNDVADDVRVTGSQPMLVGQYMQGSTSVPSYLGDPSLSIAVSTEQFRNSYDFLAPADYNQNFVNVIAPRGAAVTLDGTVVSADSFSPIGSTGYGVARIPLPPTEVHRLESDTDFGIQVYGYGFDTSYMIQGGLDLIPITLPPVF